MTLYKKNLDSSIGFFKFILVFQQVRDIRNYELFQLKTNII